MTWSPNCLFSHGWRFLPYFPQLHHQANHWMFRLKPQPSFQTTTLVFYSLLSCLPGLTALAAHPKGTAGWGPPTLANTSFLPTWLHLICFKSRGIHLWPGEGQETHAASIFLPVAQQRIQSGSVKNCQPKIQQLAKLFFNVKEHLTDSQINKIETVNC